MREGEIEYNQPPPLTYYQPPNQIQHQQPQPIQHQATQPIEHVQVGEIEYNQPPQLTHNIPSPETHNQLQPFGTTASQNSNLKPVTHSEKPAIIYNKSLVIEYVCTLCETPTKFSDFNKLDRHVHRFHSAFKQSERGTKRKKGVREEVSPRKLRWRNITKST